MCLILTPDLGDKSRVQICANKKWDTQNVVHKLMLNLDFDRLIWQHQVINSDMENQYFSMTQISLSLPLKCIRYWLDKS